MDISWYPGHMKKALREMEESIKLIDIIVEICDARIPISSRNPDVERLGAGKESVLILNKKDLADPYVTAEWERYLRGSGDFCLCMDSRNRKDAGKAKSVILKAGEKKRERDEKRGIRPRPLRVLVAGIPNSGKSTFINSYMGKKSAKTGDKPDVTKGKQWIRLSKDVEMLDTPGVLWPKFEDKNVGVNLAICGSIKDEILSETELCDELLKKTGVLYPGRMEAYYGIDELSIEDICKKKNYLMSGGRSDTDRAAKAVLDDFRKGRFGGITIERPEYERE